MLIVIVVAGLLLAFANGANDNAKGVATLIGSRTMSEKAALRYAAIATFLGCVASIWFAQLLSARFSGKGLVDADLIAQPPFMAGVALAASITVLLATYLGLPISTTHALVGGIVGVGLAAGALDAGRIVTVFLLPLLLAPGLAVLLSAPFYLVCRRFRLAMGITRESCVCLDRRYEPVELTVDGAVMLRATGVQVSGGVAGCDVTERYGGRLLGLDAQHMLDWCHIASAGAISFARGLNDTPKIAAILMAAMLLKPQFGGLAVGAAMAVGGLIAVRRVAETMSHRITRMNDGQAFAANFITAGLVIVASRFGVPVSTTHVSCGSLFGIGLATRQAHWKVVARILLAWLITLPLAALIGWVAWRMLTYA